MRLYIMYSYYLEMMFELERLFGLGTFELAQHGALVVTYHVPLETVNVCERLVAHLAGLQTRKNKKKNTCVLLRRATIILRRFAGHTYRRRIRELQGYNTYV